MGARGAAAVICLALTTTRDAFADLLPIIYQIFPNYFASFRIIYFPAVWATFPICYGIFMEEHTCDARLI